MKLFIMISFLIFSQSLFARTTGLKTDLVCGNIPMSDQVANSEDVDLKCQLIRSRTVRVGTKIHTVSPDKFFKLLVEERDGDQFAYLMWNGKVLDKEKTQEAHEDLSNHGMGFYEVTPEWRMRGVKGDGLHFSGVILSKVIDYMDKSEGQNVLKSKVVYQIFKLNKKKEKSCSINFVTGNIEQARRAIDEIPCR